MTVKEPIPQSDAITFPTFMGKREELRLRKEAGKSHGLGPTITY